MICMQINMRPQSDHFEMVVFPNATCNIEILDLMLYMLKSWKIKKKKII